MTTVERPVGPLIATPPSGKAPDLRLLQGRWARLEPLNAAFHGAQLWGHNLKDKGGLLWTYMWNEPHTNEKEFTAWLAEREPMRDPWFYSFINQTAGQALGMGAFMRLDKASGVIEIGHIWMSLDLQRTREATECIYLMMRHAFDDLGVRRLEWKCDSLNAASRRAADRFGFTFEGVFRQHMIYKNRNRDTAWYAVIDNDWPRIKAGFENWLVESNFNRHGNQKAKLQVA